MILCIIYNSTQSILNQWIRVIHVLSGDNLTLNNKYKRKRTSVCDKPYHTDNKKRRNATKPGFQRFNQVLI